MSRSWYAMSLPARARRWKNQLTNAVAAIANTNSARSVEWLLIQSKTMSINARMSVLLCMRSLNSNAAHKKGELRTQLPYAT